MEWPAVSSTASTRIMLRFEKTENKTNISRRKETKNKNHFQGHPASAKERVLGPPHI